MSAKTPANWYVQFSMLFDSMDFAYTEGGVYSIITTDDVGMVWERVQTMRKEFRDEYRNCHGAGSSRTIISIIREDGIMETRYDDDEFKSDKSLQTVMGIENNATNVFDQIEWSHIRKFRLSETYVVDSQSTVENSESTEEVPSPSEDPPIGEIFVAAPTWSPPSPVSWD
uniref:Uncharacterized protein n=1 Tax=Marseillevirus LCMAC101 TaxID=2506602 RepID=A0A481YQB7_9VIRU|nr:MAG: hypothetical protein LCMAC101_00300 [Marseillevirus LCMAC101]